jgi:hypothetical protein
LPHDGSRLNKSLTHLTMLMPQLPQSGELDYVVVVDRTQEVWKRVLDGQSNKRLRLVVEQIPTADDLVLRLEAKS